MENTELPVGLRDPKVDFDDLTKDQQLRLRSRVQKAIRNLAGQQTNEDKTEVKELKKGKLEAEYTGVIGKYMFRDMAMFKYEFLIYLLIGLFSFVLFAFDTIGFVPGATVKILPLAILTPLVIWFVKRQWFMPNKRRVPSIRVYRTGVIELRIEDISKGYITYGRGDNIQRKYITKINKHTEATTGKPIIITSEHRGENLDLLENEQVDMQGKETTALLEMNTAVVTKNVINKMLQIAQPGPKNPLFLAIIINIFIGVAILVNQLGIFR